MNLNRIARSRWLVAVLGAAGAVLLIRRAVAVDGDLAVKDEWSLLLDCLSGGDAHGTPADIARRPRDVELQHLAHASSVEGESARRDWLSQCTIASSRVLALLTQDRYMRSDRRWAIWAAEIDEIRRSFKSERLPSSEVLRAAVDQAEKLGLAPKVLPNVPRKELANVRLLDTSSLPNDPIATGSVSVSASDPIPSRDVHLLLEQESWARACIFPFSASALSTYRCLDVPDATASDPRWRWESPNRLRGDFLTRVASGKTRVYRMETELVDMGALDGEMLGVIGDEKETTLLSARGGTQISFHAAELDRLRLLRAVNVGTLSWVLPFGDELVWASASTRSSEQDTIFASGLDELTTFPRAGRELATIFERATPLACETETSRAVFLTKAAGPAAYSWERDVIFLLRDAQGWSRAMATTAAWTTTPSAGDAYPRTPTLSCRANSATVTWTEGDAQNIIRQLQCTREGCASKFTRLAGDYTDSLVADLDGKVLLIRSDVAHRIIRMRLARIEDLSRTRDVVLYDDGEVPPASPSMALHAFVRGGAALVLLRIARAASTDLFAVRLDSSGAVTLVRRD